MRQTRSPRPSPAAHAVRATTRMAPCRGWCPHPTTTPSLRISALDQTACKAGAKVLRLLRLPVMSDAVLQTKGRARKEDEAHVQCGQRQGNMLFEQLQPSTRSMLCWHTVQVYPDAASLHKDVGSAPQPYNTSTINMLRHQKWVRRCPQFSKLVPSARSDHQTRIERTSARAGSAS